MCHGTSFMLYMNPGLGDGRSLLFRSGTVRHGAVRGITTLCQAMLITCWAALG